MRTKKLIMEDAEYLCSATGRVKLILEVLLDIRGQLKDFTKCMEDEK